MYDSKHAEVRSNNSLHLSGATDRNPVPEPGRLTLRGWAYFLTYTHTHRQAGRQHCQQDMQCS